jgi:hypothetical protein
MKNRTSYSFHRGHKIYLKEESCGAGWFYVDTGEPISYNRPCKACGKLFEDGPDPCLGKLPGVLSACCGHGSEPGYIIFENDVKIDFVISKIRKVSKMPRRSFSPIYGHYRGHETYQKDKKSFERVKISHKEYAELEKETSQLTEREEKEMEEEIGKICSEPNYLYVDNNEPISDDRPCKKCNKIIGPNEIDPCIGYLPGLIGACCGHGAKDGYIEFENGIRIDLRILKIENLNEPAEKANASEVSN